MKSIIVIIFFPDKGECFMYNSKGIFVGGFILFHLILFFTYWGLDPNPYLEKQRCGQKKSFFK